MDMFLTTPGLVSDRSLRLRDSEHHHLAHVLRKTEGDELLVSDGEGVMYRCRVDEISETATRCAIIEALPGFNEPLREVVLLQSLLKNPGKMDWIVEKAVELGATRIQPMVTGHTIGKRVKIERLRRLAIAATKQCLRSRIPEISEPLSFDACLDRYADHALLLFHEGADPAQTLEKLLPDLAGGLPFVLLIGPEGGFSGHEVEAALKAGAVVLNLGPRRLRSETAAVVALARLAPHVEFAPGLS